LLFFTFSLFLFLFTLTNQLSSLLVAETVASTHCSKLSWPGWLVTCWGGIPVRRWSHIPVLTRLCIE